MTAKLSLWTERNFRYLILSPAILFLLHISLFPVVYNLIVSFQHITMLDTDTSFYGFTNYTNLFRDQRFWASLLHTLIFAVVAVPIQLALGLMMAQLFVGEMPGKSFFVALLILPAMISPIVAGASWRLMFDNQYGPINQILGWFVGRRVNLLWIINPLLVYPAILLVEIWEHTPFVFLLLLAALANVDQSLVDAAQIDGASGWTTFLRVKLPVIRPVLIVVASIRALDMVRLFEIVWALTRGGPGGMTETISIYTYLQGFQQFETSYTAAMAFTLIAILATGVFLVLRRVEISR